MVKDDEEEETKLTANISIKMKKTQKVSKNAFWWNNTNIRCTFSKSLAFFAAPFGGHDDPTMEYGCHDCKTSYGTPLLHHHDWKTSYGTPSLHHHDWKTSYGTPSLHHHDWKTSYGTPSLHHLDWKTLALPCETSQAFFTRPFRRSRCHT